MQDLAAANLNPKQLALVMELAAALGSEARPDPVADKRRAYDRDRKRRAKPSENSTGIPPESTGVSPNEIYSNPHPVQPITPNGVIPPLPVDEAFSDWKAAAERRGWPVPRQITPERRKKLQSRLREHGLDGWREAIARAESSGMLGINPPSWFDFDFLTRKPEHILRLLEGKYDESFNNDRQGSANRNRGRDGFLNACHEAADAQTRHPFAGNG